ncbi:MAG: DHHA1 domain-containing protein, partial [Alistipes sp.]|nr:DHHA1 domain-containing protein [Alistipes sp.]
TDGLCCAFSGNDEDGYRYLIGSKTVDVAQIAKAFSEIFAAKGGGKPPMIQGAVSASMEEIRELLEEKVG